MRLKLVLSSASSFIKLPLHHNYLIQSMLYKNLSSELSDFLHKIGFFYNGRRFKLFTFSKIFSSKYFVKNGFIYYKSPITIYISSANDLFPKNWGKEFIKSSEIKLGNNILYLNYIESLPNIKISDNFFIKTLSPIVANKTIIENNKKIYLYFSPEEKEFKKLIKENIKKKYEILTGKKILDFNFDINVIEKKFRIAPIKYKNFLIKGIEGIFEIYSDPKIFNAIYDAGLGSKNSQGFGMVKIIGNRD